MSDNRFPLIGRNSELDWIRAALLHRGRLFISGPHGCGKSRLIDEAIAMLAGSDSAPVRIRWEARPHDLLVRLSCALLREGHRSLEEFLKFPAEAVEHQTSVHLRGVLWKALAREPRSIVIEDVDGASSAVYRFFQPVFHSKEIAMIVTAVDRERLGFLNRLFWDPRSQLELPALSERDSLRLAALATSRYPLPAGVDAGELSERILEAAHGNPGRIIESFRMAADPRYQSVGYIKLGLIQIDLAARFIRSVHPARLTA